MIKIRDRRICPNTTAPRWNAYDFEPPFYGRLNLGNGTEYHVGVFWTDAGRLFVGIEYRGAYTFSESSKPSYVSEKLSVSDVDARNITDFINAQFGGCSEIGIYEDRFMS